MKDKKIKTYSLDEVTDTFIGKPGTANREAFENELRLDLLCEAIKQARKARNLTQEQLGQLVGVQKAQISKLENSLTDARFETILKVFRALDARINFNIELYDRKIEIA
jgi:DNA-binding XRE family transcriptional regulator